jgi:hypothetical protein
MQVGPRRQLWVEAGAAQQVEGDDGLLNETIPEMEGKVFVNTAQTSNEVIFEGADGAFRGVASVCAGGNQLIVDILVFCMNVFKASEHSLSRRWRRGFNPARHSLVWMVWYAVKMDCACLVFMGSARIKLLS